jgi:uncharacterized protein YbjT (DUF2867 family)
MRVTLVTGATGIVGGSIVRELLRRERAVRVLVRSPERAQGLLPAGCEIVPGNVTDRDSVERAMAGCSVVYHAAGLPEQWLPDDGTFERSNVGGTRAGDARVETDAVPGRTVRDPGLPALSPPIAVDRQGPHPLAMGDAGLASRPDGVVRGCDEQRVGGDPHGRM